MTDRERLKSAYKDPYKKWAMKVDRMPEAQVVAILLNLRRQGKQV